MSRTLRTIGTICLGVVLVLSGCTGTEVDGSSTDAGVTPEHSPDDVCWNLEGEQLEPPDGLVAYKSRCVSPAERAKSQRLERRRNREARLLQEAQGRRDRKLERQIAGLPRTARAAAVLAVACGEAVGGSQVNSDGSVAAYGTEFVAKLYAKYAAASGLSLPSDLYGEGSATNKFCPSTFAG